MQTTINAHVGETKVVSWLHRAKPDNNTLVVLVPGHNSLGSEGRFIEIAKHFVHHGVDCLRFNVTRHLTANNEHIVTTIGEEIAQAKAIVEKLRYKYERIVAIGHSQGGVIALQLALDGLVDGTVFLMSSFDTQMHAEEKIRKFGVTPTDLVKGAPYQTYDGRMMHYTKAVFDEMMMWEPYKMIGNWYGPSLFILGTKDDTVREPELHKAFELAHEPKEFRTIESDHRFTAEHAFPIVETVLPWMAKNKLK